MKIGRFDFGTWEKIDKSNKFPWFEYIKGACGCRFISVKQFCLTILGKECYSNMRNGSENEE